MSSKYVLGLALAMCLVNAQANIAEDVSTSSSIATTTATTTESEQLEKLSPGDIIKLTKLCFTYDSTANCLAFNSICRWIANKFHHGKCIAHLKSSSSLQDAAETTILDLDDDQIDALAEYELEKFNLIYAGEELSADLGLDNEELQFNKGTFIPGYYPGKKSSTSKKSKKSKKSSSSKAKESSLHKIVSPGFKTQVDDFQPTMLSAELETTNKSATIVPGYNRRGTRRPQPRTILSSESSTTTDEASQKHLPGYNRRGTRRPQPHTILSSESSATTDEASQKHLPGYNRRGTRRPQPRSVADNY